MSDPTHPPAPDKPTCIVAEGLLMYFSPEDRQRFFEEAFSVLVHGRGGTLIFDLTPPAEEPPPGFVRPDPRLLDENRDGRRRFSPRADHRGGYHPLSSASWIYTHSRNQPRTIYGVVSRCLTLRQVFQASVKEKTSSGVDYLA